jgi:hypothetical protein
MAILSPVFVGCGKDDPMSEKYHVINMPEFSQSRLHSQLDKLLAAYEDKGMKVSETMLPALTENEIREQCTWFPGELTKEIISLYSWRGGQQNDAWETKHPFWFRDNSFASLARAKIEYQSMMDSYGKNPEDHEMLKYSFPFASFNGGWYVLPTRKHDFNPSLKSPVISVLQGIDVYFYTIESMVSTCTEWVSHPEFDSDYTLPEDIEKQIWKKHNPRIFEYET